MKEMKRWLGRVRKMDGKDLSYTIEHQYEQL
jgi:hypothetical protein